jgi:hypothetical protein
MVEEMLLIAIPRHTSVQLSSQDPKLKRHQHESNESGILNGAEWLLVV